MLVDLLPRACHLHTTTPLLENERTTCYLSRHRPPRRFLRNGEREPALRRASRRRVKCHRTALFPAYHLSQLLAPPQTIDSPNSNAHDCDGASVTRFILLPGRIAQFGEVCMIRGHNWPRYRGKQMFTFYLTHRGTAARRRYEQIRTGKEACRAIFDIFTRY